MMHLIRQRVVRIKEERKKMNMKKIAKKMVKTIAKNWNEINELMVKTSVYSL